MKEKGLIKSLLITVLISAAVSLLSSCTNDGKTAPIYRGISISDNTAVASKSAVLLSDAKRDGTDVPNIIGDYEGRNDSLDIENPFGKTEDGNSLCDAIKDSVESTAKEKKIYYAAPGEDIYINIHIENPDNFEILSFTLNGSVYSSYMFEDGSDMETLILKYNVGKEGGIKEYTVDAVKYVDGTEIKDVRMDAERTVCAGVYSKAVLSGELQISDIGTTVSSFSVNLQDPFNLLSFFGDGIKAVIYDGEKIVTQKNVPLGESTLSFDGLQKNTLYQCALIGFYDDLSGEGFDLNILSSVAFYTESDVLFDNIEITKDSISFDFLWNEAASGSVDKVLLYLGGEFVKESSDLCRFDALLSDSEYTILAQYSKENESGSIKIRARTLKKETPVIKITDIKLDAGTASAEYTVSDPDNVILSTKASIYKNGILISERIDGKADFDSLDSYSAYKIVLDVTYDLCDGSGEKIITAEKEIKTSPIVEPISFEIKNSENTRLGDKISISVSVSNPSKAEIYAFLISGKVYNVVAKTSDTAATLLVEIVLDEQFCCGEQTFVLEGIYTHLNYVRYDVSVSGGFSDSVYISDNTANAPQSFS